MSPGTTRPEKGPREQHSLPAQIDQSKKRTHIDESSARAFQRDLYFYWSTVRAHPLSLTRQGRLYRKDLRLINKALLQPQSLGGKDEPSFPRLVFTRLLLTDLGLLRHDEHVIRAIDHPPFLKQGPAERIQQTFAQWEDGTFWNEALSIPRVTIRGAGSHLDPAPTEIVRARKSVLEQMRALYRDEQSNATARGLLPAPETDTPVGDASPEGRWVPIIQLIERIRRDDYGFLLPRDHSPFRSYYGEEVRPYSPYLTQRSPYISYGNGMGWSFSPPIEDEARGWRVVETGFICAILFEPLHWMGLVDIARLEGSPAAFRLTPVGAWVLGIGPEIEFPEGKGKVIVQPNFELFALDPIADTTLAQLDEFADRINAERAIKYRLTRESVYRAQRDGWTVDRIVKVLHDLTQDDSAQFHPLPQNVVRTLEEWQALHERVTIHRQANILQAADAELLERLLENPAIQSHVATSPAQDRRSPGFAVLVSSGPGETEVLVRDLVDAGYPPAQTWCAPDAIGPTFTPEKCITITDDGQLEFGIALPSTYLLQQIAPFTTQDERGRIFLTLSAVECAVEHGMSVDEIIHRLQRLHRGPLPHWVRVRVRAWGHYYGTAAVQTVTLVQLRDKRTLKELIADLDLEDVLYPFGPDARKSLAAVRTEDLEALYAVLVEHGITIDSRLT